MNKLLIIILILCGSNLGAQVLKYDSNNLQSPVADLNQHPSNNMDYDIENIIRNKKLNNVDECYFLTSHAQDSYLRFDIAKKCLSHVDLTPNEIIAMLKNDHTYFRRAAQYELVEKVQKLLIAYLLHNHDQDGRYTIKDCSDYMSIGKPNEDTVKIAMLCYGKLSSIDHKIELIKNTHQISQFMFPEYQVAIERAALNDIQKNKENLSFNACMDIQDTLKFVALKKDVLVECLDIPEFK